MTTNELFGAGSVSKRGGQTMLTIFYTLAFASGAVLILAAIAKLIPDRLWKKIFKLFGINEQKRKEEKNEKGISGTD